MTVTKIGIIGTGWRAQYFHRLIGALDQDLELVGAVARRPERADHIAAAWGVPCWTSPAELVRNARPHLVVTCVPRSANPHVVLDVAGRGTPVLSETPPAPTADGLHALWAEIGPKRLVQVAEQYPLLPGHAARLSVLRSGVLGEPTNVQVSSTHTYHAIALIRSFLAIQDAIGPVRVTASAMVAPLVDPLNRAGWTRETEPKDATMTLAAFDFGDGRSGVYDFTTNQWHNRLRHRRIVIRASHGEIVDDAVTRIIDPTTIVASQISRQQLGHDLNLDGYDTELISFEGRPVWRNPFLGRRFMDEEIAISELLIRTAAWATDSGPEPYPLGRACEDHHLGLAIDHALAAGASVVTEPGPWAA